MHGIRLVASDLDGTLLLPDETVSPRTRAALVAMADQVRVVAAERIAQELRRMLVHPSRARGMDLAFEVGLVAAVLFHAFNGIRVVLVDFWSKGPRFQRQMLWVVVGLWLVLMVGFLYPMTWHTWRLLFGSA
jgi:succinate dehydrogenase hydrophobic anchor subunit